MTDVKKLVEHIAGIHWPEADEGRLRADAQAWRTMASALRRAASDADAAARAVTGANSGHAVDRFEAFWASRYMGGAGAFATLERACEQMADALEKYADAVADAKRKIEERVAVAGATLVAGAIFAVVTLGASEAIAGAAAEAIVAFSARIVFGELVAAAADVIATAFTGAVMGAVGGAAIDGLIVQPIKVEGFHDGHYDWTELSDSALSGGVGGAVGGGLGGGLKSAFTGVTELSASRPALAGLMRDLPTVLDTLPARMVTGAGTNALAAALVTGHVSGLDLVSGAIGGATTKSLPEPWRARVERGIAFNSARADDYPVNELRLTNNKVLDSYLPGDEIVSRKYTQLADVQPATAVAYVKELAAKYPPGTIIADTPRNRQRYGDLVGKRLRGQMVLEVPVQKQAVPHAILDAADRYDIVIRDVRGHVYSLPEGR